MKYVALLRAVNVGGAGALPMAQLRDIADGLGWRDIATYVRSGNLVFAADEADAGELSANGAGSAEASAAQSSAAEVGAAEASAAQTSAAEVGAGEAEVGEAEASAAAASAGEVGVAEAGAAQAGADEAEASAAQSSAAEVGVAEASAAQSSAAEVGAAEAGADEAETSAAAASAEIERRLGERLTAALADALGVSIPAVVLSGTQLERIRRDNPFANHGAADKHAEPRQLHAMIALPGEPLWPRELLPQATAFAPEEYAVIGRVAYLYLPEGIGRSKLAQAFGRKGLPQVTVRNWRTIETLAAMARP